MADTLAVIALVVFAAGIVVGAIIIVIFALLLYRMLNRFVEVSK